MGIELSEVIKHFTICIFIFSLSISGFAINVTKTINLGTVYEGLRLRVKIIINNTSKKSILVKKATMSCSCLKKIKTVPFFVKPNQKKIYTAVFDSFRIKGNFQKTIKLHIENSVYPVTVSGTVKKSDKPVLYLHRDHFVVKRKTILKRKCYTIVTRISNTGGEVLVIGRIDAPKGVGVFLDKKISEKMGCSLRINILPKVGNGKIKIVINSNAVNNYSRIRIYIL